MADAQTKAHLSFRQAAEHILAQAMKPLKPEEILRLSLAADLIVTTGKTPVATMAAQLYSEIQQNGTSSVFVKAGKGLFGLRAWEQSPRRIPNQRVGKSDRVVPISTDPVDRLIAEIMTAQHDSLNSVRFEKILADAFTALGFHAEHIGGAGRTDILLNSFVSAASYRVVVDAKSNRNGKISDRDIDWNSLDDHRKAEEAHSVMVVAPDFSGGNLLKRANDYGVALLTGASLAELLRLHRRAPFTLVELRPLFETHGRTGEAVEQLRQVSQATERRWALLRELIDLIEQLPPGVFADAQKLWLLLSFQQKESAPSQEAVEDALTVLSSRLMGVLRAVNGGHEYALTMTPAMAISRIRALASLLTPDSVQDAPASETAVAETQTTYSVPAGGKDRAQVAAPVSEIRASPDFAALQAEVVRRLESRGLASPNIVSKRHVILCHGKKTVGLAFRASKCYPGRRWWWTFTKSADADVLAKCDSIVLVGLMADPESESGLRDELIFVPWNDATDLAAQGKATAWTTKGRIHVYVGDGGPWESWVRPLSELRPT